MTSRIFDYENAYRGIISYDDKNARWYTDSFTKISHTYKKFCYTSYSDICNPFQHIYAGYSAYSLHPGALLFISKDSKVSRDRIRNSGFKITYDKNKTKYVVVPAWPIRKNEFLVYNANIVVKDGDDLYLIKLTRTFSAPDSITPELKDKIVQLVKDKFGNDADISYLPELNTFNLGFLPNVEEFREMCDNPVGNIYIPDDRLPLTIQTNIDVETLLAWEKMEKEPMAIAFIMSNYKEYPLTCKVFLELYEAKKHLSFNTQFNLTLKEIGYTRFGGVTHFQPVEEKDWNLLQSWIMKRLGVSEDGGYIKHNDGDKDVYMHLSQYISHRVAVKPFKPSGGPLMFKDLLEGAKT